MLTLPASLPPLKTNLRDAQRLQQQNDETSISYTSGTGERPLEETQQNPGHPGLRFSEGRRSSDGAVNLEYARSSQSITEGCNSPKRPHSSRHRKASSSNDVVAQNCGCTGSSSNPSQQDAAMVPRAPSSKREKKIWAKEEGAKEQY